MDNQPFAEAFGSVEEELISRATHSHGLYRDDNAAVYHKMEEAFRGTQYSASLKTFQRKKDGRSAYIATKGQHCGKDKWEALLKEATNVLHGRKWKGQSAYSLEKFVQLHRSAYISMTQCAEHLTYQLPNDYTRVTYLLDGIECSDATLQATIAQIKQNDHPGGSRNDFELCATALLPSDPVVIKRNNKKRSGDEAQISSTDTMSKRSAQVSSTHTGIGSKPKIGKTGVHFRWYKSAEFRALTSEQKDELMTWQKGNRRSKATSTPHDADHNLSAIVATAVQKELAKNQKALEKQSKEKDEIDAIVKSLVHSDKKGGKLDDQSPVTVTAAGLKAILQRVKNQK